MKRISKESLYASKSAFSEWSEQEHERFCQALELYGKDWQKIAKCVKTKTRMQVRCHGEEFDRNQRANPSKENAHLLEKLENTMTWTQPEKDTFNWAL